MKFRDLTFSLFSVCGCRYSARDDRYDALRAYFSVTGRGRRPALPPISTVTNRLLKDSGENATWELIDIDFIDRAESLPTASDRMEYRAHSCPTLLRKEFKDLFPDRNIMKGDLTVVIISLKTQNDMTLWSSEVEQEREELLEIFIQGALGICQAFEDSGYWADFIDPSSGKPFKGPHTNFTLFETDERYRKLGFEIQDLGCCKVISHPVWGTHAFIGALFTSAPVDHSLVMNLHESH